jgi:hypothetical protein
MKAPVTIQVKEYAVFITEDIYERPSIHQLIVETTFPTLEVMSWTREKSLPDVISGKVMHALLVKGYEKP